MAGVVVKAGGGVRRIAGVAWAPEFQCSPALEEKVWRRNRPAVGGGRWADGEAACCCWPGWWLPAAELDPR
jgi:hypothetical protein